MHASITTKGKQNPHCLCQHKLLQYTKRAFPPPGTSHHSCRAPGLKTEIARPPPLSSPGWSCTSVPQDLGKAESKSTGVMLFKGCPTLACSIAIPNRPWDTLSVAEDSSSTAKKMGTALELRHLGRKNFSCPLPIYGLFPESIREKCQSLQA